MLPKNKDSWKSPALWLPVLKEKMNKICGMASAGQIAAGALLVLLLALILFATGFFLRTPGTAELSAIRHYEASSVYTSDGILLGRYYVQNRDEIPLEHVPQHFLDALLAIEDVRYPKHRGIDFRALGRVMVRTILLRQDAGGGSTITQQLAKNLYPRETPGLRGVVTGKLREMLIASRLERIYSKEEILELYLNTVSFGEDTWGIRTASERFFNIPPAELELHQAAVLAGMLRATTWYNPRRNPGNALRRRNLVLWQMERYGMIDAEAYENARERPLDLDYNRHDQSEGAAPHFRTLLGSRMQHILATQPALDGRTYNLLTDGLVIETTLDSRYQAAAEYALNTQLAGLQTAFDDHRDHEPVFSRDHPLVLRAWQGSERYHRMVEAGFDQDAIDEAFDAPAPGTIFTWDGSKNVTISPRDSIRHYLSFINAGFLAMDPESGDVKAWVGGIPHRNFQFDHVRARRQTGSAFKPIVYAAALESGTRPCDYRRNLLSTYVQYDEWTPSNLQQEYGGHYSVQAALSHSVNTISVELLMETGVDEVIQTIRRMGIRSPIPREPSIALGTAELSLLEMVQAYSAFANRGIPAEPRFIKAVYNSDGELIYDFSESGTGSDAVKSDGAEVFSVSDFAVSPSFAIPSRPVSPLPEPGYEDSLQPQEPAFSEETAAAMVAMLARTVDEGTASGLRTRFGIRHAVAGKTGTTQHFSDGWFVGMTPDLVFGSWVGGVTPAVRLPQQFGFASQTALPVAGLFLQDVSRQEGLPPIPDHFHSYQLDSHYRTDCENYREERFRDRARDFFTGRDSQEAQIVGDTAQDRSLIGRIRGIFRND
jgi:penicillin-binding protein 1A